MIAAGHRDARRTHDRLRDARPLPDGFHGHYGEMLDRMAAVLGLRWRPRLPVP